MLRRADERYHLWRMFENRRHPTPPPKGGGKERAPTGRRNPDVPRPKATTATAEADPKFHECLARGASRYEAFKQHKSRLRTRAYQDFYGLEPTPPQRRVRRSPGPSMMSRGGFHRRLVMSRIRSLAERGFVPTNEELATAVSMEHLANLIAERARAATGRGEETSEAENDEADPDAAPSRSRSRR